MVDWRTVPPVGSAARAGCVRVDEVYTRQAPDLHPGVHMSRYVPQRRNEVDREFSMQKAHPAPAEFLRPAGRRASTAIALRSL